MDRKSQPVIWAKQVHLRVRSILRRLLQPLINGLPEPSNPPSTQRIPMQQPDKPRALRVQTTRTFSRQPFGDHVAAGIEIGKQPGAGCLVAGNRVPIGEGGSWRHHPCNPRPSVTDDPVYLDWALLPGFQVQFWVITVKSCKKMYQIEG